ncbi:helix-turn-helix transcriptional regulator [Weissella cibaria]|nr:helix-turn-helix transcriptional regulator [Weissella cibaria]
MQEAQNWLLIPEIRIQDISYALGYSDPAHFTRQFKKWTGETPRQFQKQVSPTG